MNIQDRLIELIDEDLNQRLNLIMNDYVTIISKKHGIPMELLLRDVPKTSSISLCRGTKSNGQRCTRKGANNGYCGHRMHTKENVLNNDCYRVQTYIHMALRKCSLGGVQGVSLQTNL